MNALLRLLVFNVVPTALEAVLVVSLLGRRYGLPFLLAALTSVSAFVAWSLLVVERRSQLPQHRSEPRALRTVLRTTLRRPPAALNDSCPSGARQGVAR
jgi:ABC-type transport system involved in Fe-S cluster assembly fused permease/ATPase subunit